MPTPPDNSPQPPSRVVGFPRRQFRPPLGSGAAVRCRLNADGCRGGRLGGAVDLAAPDEEPGCAEPSWFRTGTIAKTFDAPPLIDSRAQPVGPVMRGLQRLKAGQIYELITPFLPAPLLEIAGQKGFLAWSQRTEDGCYRSYPARG